MTASRVVGLVPAAGWATRLGAPDGSKEAQWVAYPAGERRPVAHSLLAAYGAAGVDTALVVLRHGKWDVPAALGAGGSGLPRLGYLVTPETGSVVETLAVALPFLHGAQVVLGFPDCLFEPAAAAAALVAHRARARSAATLALFPSDRPEKTDMVRFADSGRVTALEVRPGPGSDLGWTWLLAAWGAELVEIVSELAARRSPARSFSDVLTAAIERGLEVDSLRFEDGSFLDVGTPEDLERARSGAWPAHSSPGPAR